MLTRDQLVVALEASRLALFDYAVGSGDTYLSEVWSQMLGGPPEPTRTTLAALTELVPPEERQGVAAAIAAVLKGPQQSYQIEYRVRRLDGELIWIMSEGRVVERDAQGRASRVIGTSRDITERCKAEEALRASEARFRHLTELSSDWYWELDEQLKFKAISGAGLAAFGLKPDDVLGLTRSEVSGSRYELLSPSEAEFERLRAERRPYADVRGRFVHADGTFRYVSINGEPVFSDDGTFCGYRGVTRDITGQTRAELALRESETQFRLAFDNSPIGMALVRPDGAWLRVNEALCALVGYSREELLARTFQDITHPEDLESDLTLLQEILDDRRQTYQMDKRYIGKNGAEIWIQLNVSLVRDPAGKPLYFVSQIQDIGARRSLQERTEQLALHDPLTGLANSRLLLDRLERTIAAAQRAQRMAGVVFLDLDGFKAVNDLHGHAAGDAVLKEVAGRLAAAVRNVDTVGRLGGDEFAVVLGEVDSAQGGMLAAKRVLAAFEAPFVAAGAPARLGASLGVALYPDHGGDPSTLLQRADSAMYRAKSEGTNKIRLSHHSG